MMMVMTLIFSIQGQAKGSNLRYTVGGVDDDGSGGD
jgi:hypothetical protein